MVERGGRGGEGDVEGRVKVLCFLMRLCWPRLDLSFCGFFVLCICCEAV